MAEEVKETMEQFETQLEESLMVELLFMLKESVDLFQHLYYQQNMLKI